MVSAGHRRLADLWARVLSEVAPQSGLASWSEVAPQSGLCADRAPADVSILLRGQQLVHLSGRWPSARPAGHSCGPRTRSLQPAAGGRAAAWGTVLNSMAAPAGRCVSAGFLPFLPSWLLVISPDLLAPGLERCHGAVNCPEEDTGSSQRIGSNSFPCSLCVRQSRWRWAE